MTSEGRRDLRSYFSLARSGARIAPQSLLSQDEARSASAEVEATTTTRFSAPPPSSSEAGQQSGRGVPKENTITDGPEDRDNAHRGAPQSKLPRERRTSRRERWTHAIMTVIGHSRGNPVLLEDGQDSPGCQSPLIQAAQSNDVQMFQRSLSTTRVSAVTQNAARVLELAAVHGYVSMVKELLTYLQAHLPEQHLNEFLTKVRGRGGLHPVHVAAQRNRTQVLDQLLSTTPALGMLQSEQGLSVAHYAAASNSADALECIINHAIKAGNLSDVLDQTAHTGATPLHVAALAHSQQCFKVLIENAADISRVDESGETSLFSLLSGDQVDLLQFVMESCSDSVPTPGADHTRCAAHVAMESDRGFSTVVMTTNCHGDTVLHCAISKGSVRCAKLLFENCPQLLLSGNRELPINTCIRTRSEPLLRHLLPLTLDQLQEVEQKEHSMPRDHLVCGGGDGAGPRVSDAGGPCGSVAGVLLDSRQRSLLHGAAMSASLPILAALLEHCRENAAHRQLIGCGLPMDDHGHTALFYLAWIGSLQAIKLLLEHCHGNDCLFDIQTALLNVSSDGRTAYFLAARNGHWRFLQCILEIGNSALSSCLSRCVCVNTADKHGVTPLHAAAMHKRGKCVKILLRNGAEITRDEHGRSALHYASQHGHVDTLRDLIGYSSRDVLDWKDGKDDTALHPPTDMEILRANDQQTALHLAAANSRLEAARLLLDRGVAILRNGSGLTAFDLAVASRRREVIVMFLRHKRWQEVMRVSNYRQICRVLFTAMPDLARILFGRFTSVDENSADGQAPSQVSTHHLRFLYYDFTGGPAAHSNGSTTTTTA
ncbi:transient receptor potential cation channel subfamily A member 1-like, partial [Sycon ciliatum]|uniref:transient receptor potential cation channel subfamily A member 1-like n=1 Tax=Sycon ciliatum TaxID=27933 RepID=UPI0031F6EFE9